MKTYKKVLIVISIIMSIALMVAFYFIYFWEGSTTKILSVANQFKTPTSWTLISEDITPPRISCWEGSGCPYVHRKWDPDSPISRQAFEELLESNGWNFIIEDDCQLPDNISGTAVGVCSAAGTVDDFNVRLRLSVNSDHPDQQQFVLTVSLID